MGGVFDFDTSPRGDMIIRIHSLPTAGNCSGASRLRSFRLSAGSLAISGTENDMHFFSAKSACLGAKNPRKLGFSSKNTGKTLCWKPNRVRMFFELHTAFSPHIIINSEGGMFNLFDTPHIQLYLARTERGHSYLIEQS